MQNNRDGISYTCPHCQTHYVVYSQGEHISESKYNQLKSLVQRQMELAYCRACKRKDPNTPTTFEMDKLFTQEDILNRHYVMRQCFDCNKWTKQDTRKRESKPCDNCGSINQDISSNKSLRTFNEFIDAKRRSKRSKK